MATVLVRVPVAGLFVLTPVQLQKKLCTVQKAGQCYTKALTLYDDADPLRWFIYYTRGIAYHTLDDWPAAEADFRAALALRPDQPQVLNYLGYSMVELGINMEEALGMIERAMAAEPQNGAIVDSASTVQSWTTARS